ncbi:hypothetical protein ABD68_23610 [Bacillus endophyticus]|uniref:5-bromo-4-chloroindolyl phosphate hydrolysis family protein n=1 Tax=Priestia endophytica TaxID=135735 RepID=UPI0018CFDC92|nr:5-bromo-4-chloroindolyl phosphate hydrolysis family protein [Priestia endophytica]MBG9814435.1 hypothetical protein [Priestia endophytica]
MIKRIIQTLLYSGLTGFVTIVGAAFFLDIPLFFSILIGIGTWSATVLLCLCYFLLRQNFRYDPYKEQKAYVDHHVKEARKSLRTLSQSRFKVKSMHVWIKINKLQKVGRSIIDMVDKEPARFYEAQDFFKKYLPSTVKIVDRYTFLLAKPTKNAEVKIALSETEDTLDELIVKYDEVLTSSISQDLTALEIEQSLLHNSYGENKPPAGK